MSERRLFPEFREQFRSTRYPFADSATLASGTVTLPAAAFLDASLYIIGAAESVYIHAIDVQPRNITFRFGDRLRTGLATAQFDPLAAADVVPVFDSYARPAGVLVVDPEQLAQFSSWELGTYSFTNAATLLVPSCVIPLPESGVRGVVTDDDQLITHELVVVGSNGVVVREEEPGVIRVDVVGDPLFRRKLCEPVELFQTPRWIKTINGCAPDADGHFNLTPGDHLKDDPIVRIYATDVGLMISAVGTIGGTR